MRLERKTDGYPVNVASLYVNFVLPEDRRWEREHNRCGEG